MLDPGEASSSYLGWASTSPENKAVRDAAGLSLGSLTEEPAPLQQQLGGDAGDGVTCAARPGPLTYLAMAVNAKSTFRPLFALVSMKGTPYSCRTRRGGGEGGPRGHESAPGGHGGHSACRGAQLRGRGVQHCRGGKAARGVTGKGVLILQSFRIGLRGQKWQRKLKERAEVEGDGNETRAEGGSQAAACAAPRHPTSGSAAAKSQLPYLG